MLHDSNFQKPTQSHHLSCFLLEITVHILRKKEGDTYLLDLILDKAGNKGTGSWSSKAAFDLGIPNTMMSSSVFARYISSFKDTRIKMAELTDQFRVVTQDIDLESIKSSYKFARLINHQQGFKLMHLASKTYSWDLNFSDIARIWSNGCIIKSHLMNQLHKEFKETQDLFDMTLITSDLINAESDLRELITLGLRYRVSTHCFSASYYYWVDMTTKNLPANLIQAQRDFFGAHTYQRIDAPESEFYHSKW